LRKIFTIMAIVSIFWFATPTHATLLDRGNGLIYDTVQNITWMQNASYTGSTSLNWSAAKTWAENLVYEGYSDWRLPTTTAGGTGYNITTSEMG
jgi:hypothetical protein